MKIVTIEFDAGRNASLAKGLYNGCVFSCNENDVDTAYDALAESLALKDPARDLITFQNLKDDDVETLLEDAKKHGFISDYEISDSNE